MDVKIRKLEMVDDGLASRGVVRGGVRSVIGRFAVLASAEPIPTSFSRKGLLVTPTTVAMQLRAMSFVRLKCSYGSLCCLLSPMMHMNTCTHLRSDLRAQCLPGNDTESRSE